MLACATPALYLRADGKPLLGDPSFSNNSKTDCTICQGEMGKVNLSGVTFAGGGLAGVAAAAERGYARLPCRGCWRKPSASTGKERP